MSTSEFDSELCDSGAGGSDPWWCFEQPSPGGLLDAVREPMMWRVQYRNFGSYQTIVGNFTGILTANNLVFGATSERISSDAASRRAASLTSNRFRTP